MPNDVIDRLTDSLQSRYHVQREVGRGGMATVYLAEDIKHQRRVAIKLLHPELGAVLGVDRFLSEIRVTANLQHPNILPLFDSGATDGLVYYVMPFVEGETLRARLAREQQLPIADVVRIAQGVASALDYAHRHGVIHRDIKPENILLVEGQALVADFGIARAVTSAAGERITQSGISVGTPQYMGPEQSGGDQAIDGRSDIYSLGCVLHEMLTGEPPFVGHNAQAIFGRKMSQSPPSARAIRDAVPEHVDRSIQRAIARFAADRFSSGDEFLKALVAPPPPLRSPRSTALVARASVAAAIVATVAILGWILATKQTQGGLKGQTLLGVSAFEALDPDKSIAADLQQSLIDRLGGVSALRVTPLATGKQAAFAGRVVDGLITRRGDTLNVNVALLGGHPQSRIWAQHFSGTVFRMDELRVLLVRSLVTALGVEVTRDERRRLGLQPVRDSSAALALQRGRRIASAFDPARFGRSIAAFEDAARAAPNDPTPLAHLAKLYSEMGLGHDTISPAIAFQRARLFADSALSIDPSDPIAHLALGHVRLWWDWDWTGAKREYELAIANDPRSSEAHNAYGFFLRQMALGDSSIAEHVRARQLDPNAPLLMADLVVAYAWAGYPDSAIARGQDFLDLEPNFAPLQWAVANAFLVGGKHDSSIAHHREAVRLNPQFRHTLAEAYASAGRWREADSVLQALTERERWRFAPVVAAAHAAAGHTDSAFYWLEVARRDHSATVESALSRPNLRRLGGDPRYAAYLRRLNLPLP